jgi:hypothetical protein
MSPGTFHENLGAAWCAILARRYPGTTWRLLSPEEVEEARARGDLVELDDLDSHDDESVAPHEGGPT